MSDAVIVALITAGAAVLSNWLITRSNREKDTAERAKKDQEVQDRLKTIEKKLDEHNGYAARFEKIGIDIAEIKTTLSHLKE